MENQNIILTPLNKAHHKLGARMIEFCGFEMPVWYTSQTEEHMAVREHAGIFDLSHMGELFFTGPQAKDRLQMLTTNNVAKLKPGKAQYSAILNDDAGIRDDVIVYMIAEERYMVVVNAANQAKIDGWVTEKCGSDSFENRSLDIALIALQGPKALSILDSALGKNFDELSYFGLMQTDWNGIPLTIARTGYTGEDGFELFTENDLALVLWDRLVDVGGESLKPVGLGARDTLRLEVCYSLYGNELEEDINPLEAGLGWVVKMKKGDFIGREKLTEIKGAGLKRKIRGIVVDSGPVPRHGNRLYAHNSEVGFITSGCVSPVSGDKIALCYLPREDAFEPGSVVEVEIHKKRFPARIVETPFYKRSE